MEETRDLDYIKSFYDFLCIDPQIPPECTEMFSFALVAFKANFIGVEIVRILEGGFLTSDGQETELAFHSIALDWSQPSKHGSPRLLNLAGVLDKKRDRPDDNDTWKGEERQISYYPLTVDMLQDVVMVWFNDEYYNLLKRLGMLIEFKKPDEDIRERLLAIGTCESL